MTTPLKITRRVMAMHLTRPALMESACGEYWTNGIWLLAKSATELGAEVRLQSLLRPDVTDILSSLEGRSIEADPTRLVHVAAGETSLALRSGTRVWWADKGLVEWLTKAGCRFFPDCDQLVPIAILRDGQVIGALMPQMPPKLPGARSTKTGGL